MSSSGGGVIIITNTAKPTNTFVTSVSDLEAIVAALPDGDLKTALQALLP